MNAGNIIILGANGQLGRALQHEFPEARALGRAQLDIADAAAIAAFDWSSVDVVINGAAYTKVDEAESPAGRSAAWAANASGPAALAAAANRYGFTLVHVSSEYVFDGAATTPMDETHPLAPLSAYGASKAAGDLAVATTLHHYLIRTSWVVGDGANFVRTMAGLAARGVKPSVVSDQIGRLTFASELARGIRHLLETRSPFGAYNLTGSGEPTSWADIARATYEAVGADPGAVTDVTTATYFADKPQAARRPLYSVLSLDKLAATGFKSADWHDSLRAYLS